MGVLSKLAHEVEPKLFFSLGGKFLIFFVCGLYCLGFALFPANRFGLTDGLIPVERILVGLCGFVSGVYAVYCFVRLTVMVMFG